MSSRRRSRLLVALGCLVFSIASGPASPQPQPGTGTLPPGSPVTSPLMRGEDGSVVVVDPTRKDGPAGRGPCAAVTICVGPGRGYATLAAAVAVARPGDTIELVAGVYRETVQIDRPRLVVRGVGGRPHLDCAGLRLVEDKGCLFVSANDTVLENLEISGAVLPEQTGANGACIRNHSAGGLVVRRVSCHASQNGILSADGSVTIEDSDFFDNGWNGQTHNVYLGRCPRAVVRRSTFREARVGHEFKSRCAVNDIADSTFRSTIGSRALDLAEGGDTLVVGGTIYKNPNNESLEAIGFAPEGCNRAAPMRVVGTRLVSAGPGVVIHNFGRCTGQPIILERVRFEGPEPLLVGDVERR